MRNKSLLITAILFFLAINTSYFWYHKLELLAFPVILLLLLLYIIINVGLLVQAFIAYKEHFKNKLRLIRIAVLVVVIITAYFNPLGIIDFEKFEEKNILIAEREGAANCSTIFKLKSNNTFIENRVCFGTSEINGTYTFRNDTIFFENFEAGRTNNELYTFAIIKASKFNTNKNAFDLVRYKNFADTVGNFLFIIKNDLTNK